MGALETEVQTVVVVIVDGDGCCWGLSLDEDAAMTLIAVASEEPAMLG